MDIQKPYQHLSDDSDQELITSTISETPSKRSGTVFGTLFNLINTIVGAGLLALPLAVKSSGLVVGIILLVVVVGMSIYSLFLLLKASEITGQYSYKDVAVAAYGKWSGYLFEFFVFIMSFGVCTAYFVLIDGMVVSLIEEQLSKQHILANRFYAGALVIVVVLFPLAVLKKISFLSYISVASVCSALFVTLVVCIHFFRKLGDGKIEWEKLVLVETRFQHFFMAFPIFFLAFGSHITLLPLYKEMNNRSITRMTIPVVGSGFASFCIYSLTGITGYLTHMDKTLGNILMNYPGDTLVFVAKIFIILVLMFGFPLIHYAARGSIEGAFFAKKPFSWKRWVIETILICGTIYLLGVLVDRIETIFGAVGATSGVLVYYIFPAVLYVKLEKVLWKRIIAGIFGVVSILLGIVSTVAVVWDTINELTKK